MLLCSEHREKKAKSFRAEINGQTMPTVDKSPVTTSSWWPVVEARRQGPLGCCLEGRTTG